MSHTGFHSVFFRSKDDHHHGVTRPVLGASQSFHSGGLRTRDVLKSMPGLGEPDHKQLLPVRV